MKTDRWEFRTREGLKDEVRRVVQASPRYRENLSLFAEEAIREKLEREALPEARA